MPRFRIKMESPDLIRDDGTPHFRVTTMIADDEDTARMHCERKEMQIAAYEYPPGVLAELEEKEAAADGRGVPSSTMVRMQLATHRQTRPYEVVDVEEVT